MDRHMLPNEASLLYDWTPNSKLAYGEFLRARQGEVSIRFGINNHNKELIATNQQLAECGIEVLSVNQTRGFTILSQNVGQVTGQNDGDINSGRLNWGFTEVLISHGQMNIPLDELVKSAKTNPQPWAYGQFEIGRDEFRRRLYKEALQSAMLAIEGQGSNSGLKTEFRFHFLVGIIRLGSYSNSSPEAINPRLAQQAFLTAAKFAESAYPADPGLSLICAGRAALIDGDIDSAISHTRKGLDFLPNHAAGIYQLGRALFLKGERKEASDRLADAILLNVEHALHASGDPDFISKMDFLNAVLKQAHERSDARYRQVAERFRRAKQSLLGFSFRDMPMDALQLEGLGKIQKIPKSSEALAATNTLFAYSAATDQLLAGFKLFQACFDEFKALCIRHLKQKSLSPPRREDFPYSSLPEEPNSDRGSYKTWLASGIVAAITMFFLQSSRMPQSMNRGALELVSDLFLIPILFAVGIAMALALLENLRLEYIRSRQKSALAAFDAAWNTYNHLKSSLENEIAAIQGMNLPMECTPPSRSNVAKQGVSAFAHPVPKRVSAWERL